MENAWYVASTSAELTDEILERKMLAREVLLYRDQEGTAHALANQCPHRGAKLSHGKIRGDCVACPFHGWEFSGNGTCRYIPSNGPEGPIPQSARVTSYPVREVAGHVWVFLGTPEHCTELVLPTELTDPEWRGVPFQAEWNTHITRAVESVLDVSHLPFVHPHTTGEVDPRVDGPEFEVGEWEICVKAKPYHPLVSTPLNEAESKGTSTITLTFPNQLILRTDMFSDNQMSTYLALTPIDDEHTKIYGVALRNFLHDVEMIDEIHYDHNVTVLDEDRPVVEGLRPKQVPLDLLQEQHVRSDGQQVRYRLMLRKALQEDSKG